MDTQKGFSKVRSVDFGGATHNPQSFKDRLDREFNNGTIAPPQKPISAVYIDGSAIQGAAAGFGVCVLFSDGSTFEIGGFERKSTNQRAELLAAIKALEFISKLPQSDRESIEVYSDSAYVCDGYNKRWVSGWKKRSWKNSEGADVANRDLWERLELCRSVAKINHLRGHSDRSGKDGANRRAVNVDLYGDKAEQHNKGNCRADEIAGWCRINRRSYFCDGVSFDSAWKCPDPKVEKAEQPTEEWSIADFKSSGISDEMIALNMQTIEGDSAVEILAEWEIAQKQSVQYVTRSAQSVMRRYENAARGGWVAWGSTIEGDRAEIAYFKPIKPRYDFSKGTPKPIKYETPGKCEALPLLSFVDEATAERIYEKYGSMPLEGESFWLWVRRCNVPIAITEGWKKALLLTEQGYPAICLRGVANWHSKGETELFPVLREFATEGRKIRIVFDQDEKPKTIANVGAQIKQLGQIYQNLGCKVFVTTWNSTSGKGIDDAFVKEGAEWLDTTIAASLTLDEWQKCGLKRQYFELIRRLKTLQITPDRDTTGDYLPPLPPEILIGSIIAIAANMGSGKSFTGINQTARRWIENGGNVLRLDALLSLGAQGSRLSNIPHSSDYDLSDSEGYSAFCRDISARHGAAICFNSLLRIPEWFLSQRPLLLILDEVNQGLDYLIQGDTLGSKQSEILDRFSEICLLCGMTGAIISAEAEIHPRSLQLLKTYSGSDNVRYFRHKRVNDPWQVTIGSGRLDGFLNKILLDAVEGAGHGESKRFLIPTDSQASGKKIERRLAREFPAKKIVRIDSETNRGGAFSEFFDDPDQWLDKNQPDFLIVSPSVKTGVSIQWAGFDAVFGFFVGAIDPDGWMQMLGRYRPNVPRFVCCSHFVVTSGDESLMMPRAVDRRLTQNKQAFSNHFAIEALTETDDRKVQIRLAAQSYYSDMSALRGAQKAIARDYVISVLNEAGHTIEIEEWGTCSDEAAILRLIKEEIEREDSAKFADSPKCDSIEDAKKLLASDCSLEDEIKAKKTLRCQEFPGRDFDNPEECYWILIRDRGNIGRGAQRQAGMENLAASKELDREQVEAICSNELGMSHRLPKQHIRALLLKQSGILNFADRGSELRNSDKRCIAIQQWAVQHAKQLRYYFGFTIAAEYIDSQGRKRHTPIDVCGKLLGAIGLTIKTARSEGKRGNQERVYAVAIDRVRDEDQETAWKFRDLALAAARERLNLIVPIETPAPKTQPESAERAESKQSAQNQSEQDFDSSYSQDFGEEAA